MRFLHINHNLETEKSISENLISYLDRTVILHWKIFCLTFNLKLVFFLAISKIYFKLSNFLHVNNSR